MTCDYDNETDQTLTFGESAATNEMCIFVGAYYPPPTARRSIACSESGPLSASFHSRVLSSGIRASAAPFPMASVSSARVSWVRVHMGRRR